MKKRIAFLALAVISLSSAQVAPKDRGVRLAFTPMLGFVNGHPGWAVDIAMSKGIAALGLRTASGTQSCLACGHEPEKEKQVHFLAGIRGEFSGGYLSLKSGVTKVERRSWSGPIGDASGDYSRGSSRFDGVGIPLQLDMALSGRHVGFALSLSALADKDGGSVSLLMGIPFGMLRW